MSYSKHIMFDQMELEQFVEEYRGTGCAPETTRVMRDSRGRFERVYGEVYQYDKARQIFIIKIAAFVLGFRNNGCYRCATIARAQVR